MNSLHLELESSETVQRDWGGVLVSVSAGCHPCAGLKGAEWPPGDVHGGFVVVQLLSHIRLFAALWTAARQASLFFTVSQGLPKFTSTELVMPSNHLIS